MALKTSIRKQELSRRKALSIGQCSELNLRLLESFKQLDFTAMRVIHTFLPISGKNEPDTFLLIQWLQQNHPHITILIPKADFETSLMTHHVFRSKDLLEKNKFEIWEPLDEGIVADGIDLVLVPLLAVDLRGYRVGYGKGFYDRFLENLTAIKLGLSFFPPEGSIEDIHENDIRLDACLLPDTIVYF